LRAARGVIECHAVGIDSQPLAPSAIAYQAIRSFVATQKVFRTCPAGYDCSSTPPILVASPAVILLIDNYDSFVFNLARYFQRLGQTTEVVRNDAIDVAGIDSLRPAAIVLSPGPCAPAQAGCSLEVVRRFHQRVPILGVCLGHQTIAEALGGQIVRADEPMHGRTSLVYHRQTGLFEGLPSPLAACRYHSLVVDRPSLPESLEVTAETADGVIMALEHHEFPVHGLQFHPESILTDFGYELLSAFFRRAGIATSHPARSIRDERAEPLVPAYQPPALPVTF
jgi:anthranilate synthase/aminodeoxychorismate synthase-like glutamine amidotransferase